MILYAINFSLFVSLLGLTDPVLIRLDVDSKLSEQLKVGYFAVPTVFQQLHCNFFCVFNDEKSKLKKVKKIHKLGCEYCAANRIFQNNFSL